MLCPLSARSHGEPPRCGTEPRERFIINRQSDIDTSPPTQHGKDCQFNMRMSYPTVYHMLIDI